MENDPKLLLSALKANPASPLILTPPLLKLAGDHGLLCLLHNAFAKGRLPPLADSEPLAQLQAAAAELEIATRLQLRAAAELAAALQQTGVNAVFAKGAALAVTVYERAGERVFADMDLLILPEDLLRAHACLTGLGYAIPSRFLGNPIEVSYVRERLPGFKICIDLHWRFTRDDGLEAAVRIPMHDLLARSRLVQNLPVTCDEDAVLLAAANLSRKSAEPLALLVDFERLLRRPLDWVGITAHAREWGLRTSLWLGLELARLHLDAPAPAQVLAELAPQPWRAKWLLSMLAGERLWLIGKQRLWSYRLLFKLLCIDNLGDVSIVVAALRKGIVRKLGGGSSLSDQLAPAADIAPADGNEIRR